MTTSPLTLIEITSAERLLETLLIESHLADKVGKMFVSFWKTRNCVTHRIIGMGEIGETCYISTVTSPAQSSMRFFFLLLLTALPCAVSSSELDFNRDVRPILSDKCFKCHGPDAKNQKSDFRIDTFEHATEDLGDYAGIEPGNLKDSEVHWRLQSDDPIDMMPPPEAKMPLTAEEIQILDRWIEQGAEYDEHWSFAPIPKSIEAPKTKTSWGHNTIDQFILAKLEENEFPPSEETSREKWIRRVTLDLTGLPPTLPEIDAFLADSKPGAYERVVERLFETDAYAERLTAEWLDVARYSDTYGFQVDRDRSVWPWRDWVIRAFRENLPYDDFITWQLAGDLLPNPTHDQILATTFNRLHSQKVEGGSVPEEFRIEYVSDRVHTYGTAFLGLTMECSRCHDHKYDPITAKDYFSLSAYFDKIDEAGLYSFFTPSVPTPTLWLPSEEQEKQVKELEATIESIEKKLSALGAKTKPRFENDEAGKSTQPLPQALARFSFDERKGQEFANAIPEGKPAKTNGNNPSVTGKLGQGVRLTGDDALTLPVGNFSRDDPFSISLWIQTPDLKERAVILSRSKAWTDAASRGYELLLEDGKLSAALIHFYPGNAIRVRATKPLPVGEWKHVTWTYDGSSRASGVSLYVDGKRIETEVIRDQLTREITGGGSDNIVIGQRMRDKGFKNGLVDEVHIFDQVLFPTAVAAVADNENTFSPDLDAYLQTQVPEARELRDQLHEARKERSALVKKISEIMVMRESSHERQTYLLERGHYENRGDPVNPATPAFLPAISEDLAPNRLGLAQWTTSPENPLTARVTVNRYWQMLFGTGLVPTSEDFGSQGSPPSHPELLDWLARDFMDHGWDLRHFLRQVVLSATYRQSSKISSGELADKDPENTLLYRFPAPRLPAETIRDNALAATGLLVAKVGGPSVKPYDIEVSFKPSKPGTGEALYRRSLYTYWKQTAPAPLMTTLNSSKRDVCRVRLEKTDSPLQGLVMLNSPQFVEAARHLASDLVKKFPNNNEAIVVESFRRLTSRQPDAEERKILGALLAEQQEHFANDPGGARKMLAVGSSPPPAGDQLERIAAVTTLVSTLLNFDEFITQR